MEQTDELLHITVEGELADLAGEMIRDVLQKRYQMSRKLIRKLVEGQGLLVNGEHVWVTWRLKAGDTLRLLLPAEESDDILPEPIPFTSMYEDDDVLVVDKQAGLIVHPTSGHWTGTLANGIVYDWKQRGIRARFRPVHRIDQWTSGLIVIAKTHYAHKLLSDQMAAREIERSYAAIVHGLVEADSALIDKPIGRADEDFKVRVIREDGQEARTQYWVQERFGEQGTLVELKLQTGRTHQIRVHMKSIGHTLFGDEFYGAPEADAELIQRQALHAKLLGFEHPRTKEWLRFESPLPEDMQALVEKLRGKVEA